MQRLTDEQWERIRKHFPEEFIPDDRPRRKPIAVRGVFAVRPGITGLAQISEFDMSTPELLAKMDSEMITPMTLSAYFRYLFLTIVGRGSGDRIRL